MGGQRARRKQKAPAPVTGEEGGREAGRSKEDRERANQAGVPRGSNKVLLSQQFKMSSPDGILRYKTQKTPWLGQ